MNDLIEKFAEQCTKIEENPFGMDVVVFDKEKFAELIILECAKFVGEQRNDVPACGWEFEGSIKEHFGVAE